MLGMHVNQLFLPAPEPMKQWRVIVDECLPCLKWITGGRQEAFFPQNLTHLPQRVNIVIPAAGENIKRTQ